MSEEKAQSLIKLMTDLLKQATLFRELLMKEQEFVVRHELNKLESLTKDKMPLIQEMESFGEHFKSILAPDMLSKAAMEKAISQLSPQYQAEVIALWEPLKDRLAECEKLNLVNGMTILTARNEEAKLLQAMLGSPQKDSTTYTKKAAIHQTPPNHKISRA